MGAPFAGIRGFAQFIPGLGTFLGVADALTAIFGGTAPPDPFSATRRRRLEALNTQRLRELNLTQIDLHDIVEGGGPAAGVRRSQSRQSIEARRRRDRLCQDLGWSNMAACTRELGEIARTGIDPDLTMTPVFDQLAQVLNLDRIEVVREGINRRDALGLSGASGGRLRRNRRPWTFQSLTPTGFEQLAEFLRFQSTGEVTPALVAILNNAQSEVQITRRVDPPRPAPPPGRLPYVPPSVVDITLPDAARPVVAPGTERDPTLAAPVVTPPTVHPSTPIPPTHPSLYRWATPGPTIAAAPPPPVAPRPAPSSSPTMFQLGQFFAFMLLLRQLVASGLVRVPGNT